MKAVMLAAKRSMFRMPVALTSIPVRRPASIRKEKKWGTTIAQLSSTANPPPDSDFETHDDFKPQTKQQFDMKDIEALIKKDIEENPLMIYMKGTPNMPRCGFSKSVVEIFRHLGYDFRARDVLQNEILRQGIKDFSDWPTVPQVYVDGEFVGGCDIMIEMFKNGELEELLSTSSAKKLADLNDSDPH